MSWLDTWRTFIGTTPPVQDAQTRGNGMIVLAPRPAQSAAALPRNLKRLREAKGLRVAELARDSDVSGSTIRVIEQGIPGGILANPTLTIMLRLSSALGVGIEELVGERER